MKTHLIQLKSLSEFYSCYQNYKKSNFEEAQYFLFSRVYPFPTPGWPLNFCLQIPVYFQVYFKNVKYFFLSAFSGKERAKGTICNARRSFLHTAGGL